jgi:hypothetical protein
MRYKVEKMNRPGVINVKVTTETENLFWFKSKEKPLQFSEVS